MRRVSDCAVVRSTTDGHDAHVACGNSTDCYFAICYFAICYFAICNFACGNFAVRDGSCCDVANFACCDVASRDFDGVSNKRGRFSNK